MRGLKEKKKEEKEKATAEGRKGRQNKEVNRRQNEGENSIAQHKFSFLSPKVFFFPLLLCLSPNKKKKTPIKKLFLMKKKILIKKFIFNGEENFNKKIKFIFIPSNMCLKF